MSSLESSHLERGRLQKPLPFEREGEREREKERNESALFLLLFFLNTYIRARERENQTTPHGAEFEREFFHRVVVV